MGGCHDHDLGYGDVSPKTAEGRMLAVALVTGIFTATVASLFFREEQDTEMTRLTKRLEALEAKVDQVLAAMALRSDKGDNT